MLIKLLGRVGPEGSAAFIRAGAELWARFGYTTAQDGRSAPPIVEMLKKVGAEGGLPIDVVADIIGDTVAAGVERSVLGEHQLAAERQRATCPQLRLPAHRQRQHRAARRHATRSQRLSAADDHPPPLRQHSRQ